MAYGIPCLTTISESAISHHSMSKIVDSISESCNRQHPLILGLQFWCALFLIGASLTVHSSTTDDVLPHPDAEFNGRIAVSVSQSQPDWPKAQSAPKGAPNIVIVLLDDIGFADTSTFGGLAQTPELDSLAQMGLRYINFNTTGMCSPTRAALLTGRNHHRVGFGVAETARGFPGYDFIWRGSTASIAEVLRRNGYSSAAFGKWHNTPYKELSPVGPFDRWPTNLGFEYFYGFIAGEDNQWEPSSLFRNTTPVEAHATPKDGYHLTTDITDEAIRWLQTHQSLAPEKPYILYYAPGAVHSPHHAPEEWIQAYRGRFDKGWDALRAEVFSRQKKLGVIPADAALTPRPKGIAAWDTLNNEEKTLYARQMEVYAGFITHTDHEIGRLLRVVRQQPSGENTLILYIAGDNGAAPGQPNGGTDGLAGVREQLQLIDVLGSANVAQNFYATGWAWLGNTPFQWWKSIASHFGGIRAPMVVSWPAQIKDNRGIRDEFTHVVDVAATIYDVTGIRFPSVVDGVQQEAMDGLSFAQTFESASRFDRPRTQYFEMLGNRAIYQDGWMASARHLRRSGTPDDSDYADDRWELYHVEEDFSQSEDLAASHPELLVELKETFEREAWRNDVYPFGVYGDSAPALTDEKRTFVYYPGQPRLQKTAVPALSGESYRITINSMIPEPGAEGAIVSYGGRESGFALYIKDDQLHYENNPMGGATKIISSNIPMPRGSVVIEFDFVKERSGEGIRRLSEVTIGKGRLLINGQLVGEGEVRDTLGAAYSASFGIGRAFGSPISEQFSPPFAFTGSLESVTIELR